jgi:formylglycine-generating enzyme required for sulfatase activity
MTNCLAGDAGTQSCCTSPEVTGGTYYEVFGLDGGPVQGGSPATVSSFRLDTYLVTVGRFRQFVKAWNKGAGYTPPEGSGMHTYLNGGLGLVNSGPGGGYESGWSTSWNESVSPTYLHLMCGNTVWTPEAGANENLPMDCVNWYEAYAFCIWDGGFLPSAAEWEYAAVGGGQAREYPWGSTAPGTTNQYAIYGCYYPDAGGDCIDSPLAPVGTAELGAGRWGQLDLAGEVYEWVLDAYDWPDLPTSTPCMNCANCTSTLGKLQDGCSSGCTAQELASMTDGSGGPPTNRDGMIGFRCARSP